MSKIFNSFVRRIDGKKLYSSIPLFLFGSYYMYNKRSPKINFGECSEIHLEVKPYFLTASTLNPKYDKRWKGGEDALYISPNKRFLCVMDGVGGWINKLVDTGIMTKEMSKRIEYEYEERYSKGHLDTLN